MMLRTITLLLSLLILTSCARLSVIQDDQLSISTNKTAVEIQNAIKQGASDRGWTVIDQAKNPSNEYLLELNQRKHYLKIKIEQQADQLVFSYQDSRNLRHDPKANTIHRKYRLWVRNLKLQIAKYL